MELKHDAVRKVERNEPKVSKVRAFATAAVLASGLALFGAGTAKADVVDTKDVCGVLASNSKTYNVKAGDSFSVASGMISTKYDPLFKVVAVDGKGVVLNNEIFRSSDQFRLGYGQERKFGEFCFRMAVKVEKGESPGTAKITVTNWAPVTEELTCLSEVNMLCMAYKTLVNVGDPILAIEFVFEKAGFFSWNISKIDDKGIEIGGAVQIFMSEHATTKPFRVNFGETKAFGEPAAGATITAEKGPKPGTAIVTIVPSEGSTEAKKLPPHWGHVEQKEIVE